MIHNPERHDLNILKKNIAKARTKLQNLWDSHGLTDEVILEAGNEFDALLNEYQKRSKL